MNWHIIIDTRRFMGLANKFEQQRNEIEEGYLGFLIKSLKKSVKCWYFLANLSVSNCANNYEYGLALRKCNWQFFRWNVILGVLQTKLTASHILFVLPLVSLTMQNYFILYIQWFLYIYFLT